MNKNIIKKLQAARKNLEEVLGEEIKSPRDIIDYVMVDLNNDWFEVNTMDGDTHYIDTDTTVGDALDSDIPLTVLSAAKTIIDFDSLGEWLIVNIDREAAVTDITCITIQSGKLLQKIYFESLFIEELVETVNEKDFEGLEYALENFHRYLPEIFDRMTEEEWVVNLLDYLNEHNGISFYLDYVIYKQRKDARAALKVAKSKKDLEDENLTETEKVLGMKLGENDRYVAGASSFFQMTDEDIEFDKQHDEFLDTVSKILTPSVISKELGCPLKDRMMSHAVQVPVSSKDELSKEDKELLEEMNSKSAEIIYGDPECLEILSDEILESADFRGRVSPSKLEALEELNRRGIPVVFFNDDEEV